MSVKEMSVFPTGEKNDAFAQYFVGQSYLNMLSTQQVSIGNVTFEPGCRNNWHIHHAEKGGGQMLLVTAGEGWYQEWGCPARKLKPGDVVHIPAGVKHWHGAAPDSWFITPSYNTVMARLRIFGPTMLNSVLPMAKISTAMMPIR